jgi:hypothetical protein
MQFMATGFEPATSWTQTALRPSGAGFVDAVLYGQEIFFVIRAIEIGAVWCFGMIEF